MGVEQYRALFATESEEHLQIISNAVLNLEKDPHNAEILNEIFRSAHTLKGMSATMGFESLTKLTHKMEDVLDVFRSQRVSVTTDVVDILFQCLDMLQMLLDEVKTQEDHHLDISALLVQLNSVIPSASAAPKPESAHEKKDIGLTGTEKQILNAVSAGQDQKIYSVGITLAGDCQLKSVRVFMIFNKLGEFGEIIKSIPSVEDLELNRFDRLFTVLFLTKTPKKKIEEVMRKMLEVDRVEVNLIKDLNLLPEEKEMNAPAADAAKTAPARDLIQQMGFKKIQSVRVSTQRLDKLMNFVGELVISKIRLMQIAQIHQLQSLYEVLTNIDRLTSDLQDEVMQARLIPMSQVFDRFPRMVRDLAHNEQKQVNFELSGGEIELDRTVLDEIADPLVHLLRNSIDHGIELPEARRSAGKNSTGTVRLSARRERTYVLIEVSDDGKGIDPNSLRVIAVQKGFMTEEEVTKLNDRDILNLIMLPGFSSAETITDTSGRGVGMDVVKMKIESLGGTLSFDSEVGKGSRFQLKLPLTVAIIRAMLVQVHGETYATPIANIAETVKLSEKRIKRIEKMEVINLRDEVLPLLRMEKVLGNSKLISPVETEKNEEKEISIVVVESSGKKAGLVVDEVLGQQEVVIKSMGALLKGIKGFSGATILGDGRVALILDVSSLV